jgi:hypothetical protein
LSHSSHKLEFILKTEKSGRVPAYERPAITSFIAYENFFIGEQKKALLLKRAKI